MKSAEFYQQLEAISRLSPFERRGSLLDFHRRTYEEYIDSLARITQNGAPRVVPDGRTVAQVVGHIIEWDRAAMISLGEILSGVAWPRLMSRNMNIDQDGTTREFADTDDFNAYYARVYASQDWEDIKTRAIDVATSILRLVEEPSLLTSDRLEQTRRYQRYKLPIGVTLSMPCGWYLWMVTVEHEGVEHVEDLKIGLNRSGT